MNIVKKIHSIITGYKTKDVEGAEVWMVSWNARHGGYMDDYHRVAKAFLDVDDAKAFMESLVEAKKLLQYTENLNIKLEKQE